MRKINNIAAADDVYLFDAHGRRYIISDDLPRCLPRSIQLRRRPQAGNWYIFDWRNCQQCKKYDTCDTGCPSLAEIAEEVSDLIAGAQNKGYLFLEQLQILIDPPRISHGDTNF